MLYLLILLLIFAPSASATGGASGTVPVLNPISRFCNSTAARRTYQPNSTFEANLLLVWSLQSWRTPRRPVASPLAPLAPPQTPSTASRSVDDVQQWCGRSKEVTVYRDTCQLWFSEQDFVSAASNIPETAAWNINNITEPVFPGWDPTTPRVFPLSLAPCIHYFVKQQSGQRTAPKSDLPPRRWTSVEPFRQSIP